VTTAKKLKRVVSTPMLALYGIGNIVGAGVYVLIGKIAEPAGYLAILAFLIAALVAFCAALSYAELAARFPVSAGVSVYLHEAFKSRIFSTVVGAMLVIAGTVSTATLLKGFAGYLHALVPLPQWTILIGISLLLLLLTLRGTKESVGTAALLTLLEVGGLIFLVVSILITKPDAIATFSGHFVASLNSIDGALFAGVISSSFIAFYAFVGFEDMVNVAEEVKEPQKAFPRAILWSMLVVTLLYIAVAVVAMGVLSPQALGASSAPLTDAYAAATGQTISILVIASLVATLNGAIVNIIMGSRFLYGMARRGWIGGWFNHLSHRSVPSRGLTIVALGALFCALLVPIERLAEMTSLLLLFVFFSVNASLIMIRKRTATAHHLRIAPTFLPWVGAIMSAALLIGQIVLYIVM
jgi:APA family basic amino acid/polyamine antiporter